jgi:hypothetical protein
VTLRAFVARRSRLLLCALCAALVLGAVIGRRVLMRHFASALVCRQEIAPVDALLIENFDPNYLLFERAEALYRAGYARRILVPVEASPDSIPSVVGTGFVEVMSRVARLPPPEVVPIQEIEPIELNAARQVARRLQADRIQSVMIVTAGLRSRRSHLVYEAVLAAAGIRVVCEPVFGQTRTDNWWGTWHGIQEVLLQSAKLQYYRFYVLPFQRRILAASPVVSRVDRRVDERADGVHDRPVNLLDPRRRLFGHVQMDVGVGAHPSAVTARHGDRR